MSQAEARLHGAQFSRLYLWLGERQVQLGALEGGRRPQWHVLAQTDVTWAMEARASPSALYEALRVLQANAQGQQLAGRELRVIVADMWVGMATLPWCADMAHHTTAHAFAVDVFKAVGIDVDALDEVRIDDAPYGAARLAIAYPGPLLAHLAQMATQWRLRCAAVRPVSVLVWDVLSGFGPLEAAAIVGDERVTLAVGTRGHRWLRPRLLAVRAEPRDGLGQSSVLRSLELAWQRWSLRHPEGRDIQRVQVVDATIEQSAIQPMTSPLVQAVQPWFGLNSNPHWLRRFSNQLALDALAAPTTRRWWYWALLGVAALLAAALAIQAINLTIKAQHLRTELALQGATRAPSPPTGWTPDELRTIAAVNVAIRQLNVPFEAFMQALMPPRDIQVAVLAIETTNESVERLENIIKITAEASSSADMTRYVAFVAHRKPFVGAYLVRHEIQDADRIRYRFVIEAKWME